MISVIIVRAKCAAASVCNYPSNNITVKHYLGTVRLLQPKTKQSYICQHGEHRLPAPNLFFERDTCMAYSGILIVRSDAYRVDWNPLLMSSGLLSNLTSSRFTLLIPNIVHVIFAF